MLEQCTVFSCYGVEDGHFNISDGCSFIPDVLLNYESCVIHDLCYITPASTKPVCDRFMEANMNSIYCDNVNRYLTSLPCYCYYYSLIMNLIGSISNLIEKGIDWGLKSL